MSARSFNSVMVKVTSLVMGGALGVWISMSPSADELVERIVAFAVVACFQSLLVQIADEVAR